MFTTYIIQSILTRKYYIGSTSDLVKRLEKHAVGLTSFTKNKGPFIVVYTETFETRSEAVRRELQIKSYKGGNAFKQLIGWDAGAVNRNRL